MSLPRGQSLINTIRKGCQSVIERGGLEKESKIYEEGIAHSIVEKGRNDSQIQAWRPKMI